MSLRVVDLDPITPEGGVLAATQRHDRSAAHHPEAVAWVHANEFWLRVRIADLVTQVVARLPGLVSRLEGDAHKRLPASSSAVIGAL